VIAARADAAKPHVGLTSWKNAPAGPVRKGDVSIAKNYLDAEELNVLNRIVNAYLEFAELQALNKQPMHMADWIIKLDDFLKLTRRGILTHAGGVSHEAAKQKAEAEFEKYHEANQVLPRPVDRDFESALDELKRLQGASPPPPAKIKKPARKKKPGGKQDEGAEG
jgi:hypothetical protein